MAGSKMKALGSTQARRVTSPRHLMKGLGKEALARCGGCGHSGEEHRDGLSCTVPICTCTGYFSMDRILPQRADTVAVRLPAVRHHGHFTVPVGERVDCRSTSIVEGELTCR